MFVYTLPLQTNQKTAKALNRRFDMAQDIYIKTLKEILKRTAHLKKDPRYKKAYKFPKGKARNDILKELDKDYDLQGKFTFGKFANNYRNKQGYGPYIPSDVAAKLGFRAWDAYSKVKFAKGAQRVNLRETLTSFEAKGDTGIVIRKGLLKMGTKQAKLEVPVRYAQDAYEEEALSNDFKYNRVIRKKVKGKWKFFVQMIFDGTPPQKNDPNYSLQTDVGVDTGLVYFGVSTDYETKIFELAPEVPDYTKQVKVLQRKLDRQRRANNPQNYNVDGTVKKGPKTWVDSKRYLKTKDKLADLQRKSAETRKFSHKEMANKILEMGTRFVVKKLNYKNLQEKKDPHFNELTGRHSSRKHYGKLIGNRAPSLLVEQLKYKASFQNKEFIEAETVELKPSQLNHITESYENPTRFWVWKDRDGSPVYSKLYSAFLLQHVKNDGKTVDLETCKLDFDDFLQSQKEIFE